MISKSGQISFKSIHINAKDINNETKSFVIGGNATIDCLKNEQGQDKFVLKTNNKTNELNHIDSIEEINSGSVLTIKSSEPLSEDISIEQIKSNSSVHIEGSANANIQKVGDEGSLILLDNSRAKIGTVEYNGILSAGNSAKSDVKHLHGTYHGEDNTKNSIDQAYSGANIYLNTDIYNKEIGNASTTVNYFTQKNFQPLTVKMLKRALINLENHFNGRLSANLNDDSTFILNKGMTSPVIPYVEQRSNINTSLINVNDRSRFEVRGRVEGNTDINLDSKKPLKCHQYNLLATDHVDGDTKITQQGYSKSALNQFDGQIQLLNNSYSKISELYGKLDMGKKLINKESDLFVDTTYKTNNSLADVEKIASTANINLTSNAILRYKEKDENAVINRTGLLNKGSYHQVKEFD